MFPPIYEKCSSNAVVKIVLGNPVRLYPFGQAPQITTVPYAVWQTVTGLPENFLGNVPDLDTFTIQIDIYADSASQVRDVARALRDAIEPLAYVTAWRGESIDPDTKRYRYSLDVDWKVQR
ncbi:DUF3168 domain-containing protein [Pseudomonas aeruginosa]|uniref:DUF3168 domain-containing protein n=1 Tax=Pseudomonas aeruginosa TaxID=287 RepID=UPI0010673B70|nr:DUF3168 domain-containing protein [Pseudomonas aeruginosa]TEP56666.1 DUF3168 domain-containing protein [Pseudomonas aeruginosa]TEP75390.1 DUF3168 domain-containing protein [Pseudomonas aeruginosa]